MTPCISDCYRHLRPKMSFENSSLILLFPCSLREWEWELGSGKLVQMNESYESSHLFANPRRIPASSLFSVHKLQFSVRKCRLSNLALESGCSNQQWIFSPLWKCLTCKTEQLKAMLACRISVRLFTFLLMQILKKQVWRRLAYFLMYSFGLPEQLSGLLWLWGKALILPPPPVKVSPLK